MRMKISSINFFFWLFFIVKIVWRSLFTYLYLGAIFLGDQIDDQI